MNYNKFSTTSTTKTFSYTIGILSGSDLYNPLMGDGGTGAFNPYLEPDFSNNKLQMFMNDNSIKVANVRNIQNIKIMAVAFGSRDVIRDIMQLNKIASNRSSISDFFRMGYSKERKNVFLDYTVTGNDGYLAYDDFRDFGISAESTSSSKKSKNGVKDDLYELWNKHSVNINGNNSANGFTRDPLYVELCKNDASADILNGWTYSSDLKTDFNNQLNLLPSKTDPYYRNKKDTIYPRDTNYQTRLGNLRTGFYCVIDNCFVVIRFNFFRNRAVILKHHPLQ
jgi:hypothetical protein